MSDKAIAIPISAAEEIAKKYGYHQVVILARRVGMYDGKEHVTTYGTTRIHCDVAARMGDKLKYEIMGWPR